MTAPPGAAGVGRVLLCRESQRRAAEGREDGGTDGGTDGVWESEASVTAPLSPENLQEGRDLKPGGKKKKKKRSWP